MVLLVYILYSNCFGLFTVTGISYNTLFVYKDTEGGEERWWDNGIRVGVHVHNKGNNSICTLSSQPTGFVCVCVCVCACVCMRAMMGHLALLEHRSLD